MRTASPTRALYVRLALIICTGPEPLAQPRKARTRRRVDPGNLLAPNLTTRRVLWP